MRSGAQYTHTVKDLVSDDNVWREFRHKTAQQRARIAKRWARVAPHKRILYVNGEYCGDMDSWYVSYHMQLERHAAMARGISFSEQMVEYYKPESFSAFLARCLRMRCQVCGRPMRYEHKHDVSDLTLCGRCAGVARRAGRPVDDPELRQVAGLNALLKRARKYKEHA